MSVPIVIVESDDWGPGPVEHATALNEIYWLARSITDKNGKNPSISIGVILSSPDSETISKNQYTSYARKLLNDEIYRPVLDVLYKGIDDGIFFLHLHGLEHFWPGAVLAAAKSDPAIGTWLTEQGAEFSEDLPSHLQSRWIDTTYLPSSPLPEKKIETAVLNEVRTFENIFGNYPVSVVPPTFIWQDTVERAWKKAGLQIVITPGRRFINRDIKGAPVSDSQGRIRNCQQNNKGMVYLVRDIYFEPLLGHKGLSAVNETQKNFQLGRPSLLETHRNNFVGKQNLKKSLWELQNFYNAVLTKQPETQFLNIQELSQVLCNKTPSYVKNGWDDKISFFLKRILADSVLKKICIFNGSIIFLYAAFRLSSVAKKIQKQLQ